MKKAQHTPGPWEFKYYECSVSPFKGYSIFHDRIDPEEGDNTICGIHTKQNSEDEANARLIAAAPEMYRRLELNNRLLKELCEKLPQDEMTVFNAAQNIIRLNNAAIAKAEGV
jgi:hypothetical protein